MDMQVANVGIVGGGKIGKWCRTGIGRILWKTNDGNIFFLSNSTPCLSFRGRIYRVPTVSCLVLAAKPNLYLWTVKFLFYSIWFQKITADTMYHARKTWVRYQSNTQNKQTTKSKPGSEQRNLSTLWIHKLPVSGRPFPREITKPKGTLGGLMSSRRRVPSGNAWATRPTGRTTLEASTSSTLRALSSSS